MNHENLVRVRFAPSPTGYLHVGGARSALYNYLFAKKNSGTFVLRVEDTDLERSSEESLKSQLASLNWLGLSCDEGVTYPELKDFGGSAPYRQSQRLEIYKAKALELIAAGRAFYCFQPLEEKAAPSAGRFLSPDRDGDPKKAQARIVAGENAVIRFRAPENAKVYRFKDLIRGEIEFSSDMIGDFVLLRTNDMPVYNYCCVVDDHLMRISHVLRAEEHLSNSLRQLMLYEAFGWTPPEFGHISLILGPDKQKLSKRHGATSVIDFAEKGFLPSAMVNYLSLLGWTHPEQKEIFDLKELISKFDLGSVHASPAVFDEVKLKWVNAQHLRALNTADFKREVMSFLTKDGIEIEGDDAWWAKAAELFKPKVETVVEAAQLFKLLSKNGFKVAGESKEALSWESSKAVLKEWRQFLGSVTTTYLTDADFVRAQEAVKTGASAKGKFLFMPLRIAILGMPHGAEINGLVPLIPCKTLIERVDNVLSLV